MLRENAIAAILDYFREHEDDFIDAIEGLDSWNGYLGDERLYNMEDLDDLYGGVEPSEVLRRAFFGYDEDYKNDRGEYTQPFNPNKDYFHFNGYGNLVSSNYKDYSAWLDKYFVEEYIDNINNIYDVPEEVQTIIDSIGEEDDE